MTTTPFPKIPAGYDEASVIERSDGYYWQDKLTDEWYGPFPTRLEALQAMQDQDDGGYEEGESLGEAEAEIGIADWIDPETGEPAEDSTPHLNNGY